MSADVKSADVKSTNVKQSEPKDKKPKVNFFKKVARYFKDMKSEFKKIVWPTKKQIMNNTLVVIVFMALSAVVIWSIDWVFINVFKLLF